MGVYNRKTMKWATPLLVVACVASALAKQQRAFSLFSVVSFPNDECTTTTDATMKGICRTAEECGDSGGTESGNCASGFGVCCYHTIVAAGEITNNLTYIQNTGYPTTTGSTADTASKSAAFTVREVQISVKSDWILMTSNYYNLSQVCAPPPPTTSSPSPAHLRHLRASQTCAEPSLDHTCTLTMMEQILQPP